MTNYTISIVSYKNTLPFKRGLEQSGIKEKYNLTYEYDVPSVCASKLIHKKTDIGLIPVAAINEMKEHFIISDYCLGSYKKVKSVLLCSNLPFDRIHRIALDSESRSTNILIKILYRFFWKKDVQFFNDTDNVDAHILIGDKALYQSAKFKNIIDLSEQWFEFTGLPFVFAAWVSYHPLDNNFLKDFNSALAEGFKYLNDIKNNEPELYHYIKYNMDYTIDNEKKKAINLFLSLINKLSY